MRIALVLALVGGIGCNDELPGFALDMSAERDAGRFFPDRGDRVFIAGNFNDWDETSHPLEDGDGDWIYKAPIPGTLSEGDSLQFKFYVAPGDGRALANQGWESVPDRKATVAELGGGRTYAFDVAGEDAGSSVNAMPVVFRVGMANQRALGFFEPDSGDRVVVSGTFTQWSESGIPLEPTDREGVYASRLSIPHQTGEPVEYKFRIVTDREVILPNEGWESRPNRRLDPAKGDPDYAEFGDLRRVVRFVLDASGWEQAGTFQPDLGDILQIELELDGEPDLSDTLVRIRDGRYETAVAVPPTVRTIRWRPVVDLDRRLGEWALLDAPLSGTTVER